MSVDSEAARPSVTVVVSAYNEARSIAKCIESLLTQQLRPDCIVVVNDGSSDNTAQILEQYHGNHGVTAINLSQNVGVPGARNTGISRSKSDIVAFLDADACAPANWLKELLRPFADTNVVVTGGPDRSPPDDQDFAQAVDYSLHSWIASGRLRMKNPFAAFVPAGCNLAIRRSALDKYGKFDERLNRRGEEKELIQRLRRGGGRVVYCERSLIWHHRRVAPAQFWRQNYLSGRARVDILRLAPDAFNLPHLAPVVMVLTLFCTAMCVAWTGPASLCFSVVALYLLLLLADGIMAAISTRSWRVSAWVPVTTAMIHWGYGIGSLVGAVRWVARYPVGSGSVKRVPETD
jgi:GT2 family glycosyltransferase